MICPIMTNPCTVYCEKENCAWWLGEGCAVLYVGANCKQHIRPWNERNSDER